MATDSTPAVVLVHGLWTAPRSCVPWIARHPDGGRVVLARPDPVPAERIPS